MLHRLVRRQTVHASLDVCWDFFSNPANLSLITPSEMDFRIVGELPVRMYPGLMIEYRVRPLFGIPVTWVSEITHLEQGRYFVDEQRIGPYRIWHHEHHFREVENGAVEVTDLIYYELHLAPLTDFLAPILVKPQLDKIFSFRTSAIENRFAPSAPATKSLSAS